MLTWCLFVFCGESPAMSKSAFLAFFSVSFHLFGRLCSFRWRTWRKLRKNKFKIREFFFPWLLVEIDIFWRLTSNIEYDALVLCCFFVLTPFRRNDVISWCFYSLSFSGFLFKRFWLRKSIKHRHLGVLVRSKSDLFLRYQHFAKRIGDKIRLPEALILR